MLALAASAQGPSTPPGTGPPRCLEARSALGASRLATGRKHAAPNRDGSSAETDLPSSWDIKGTNLLWRAPFGGALCARS